MLHHTENQSNYSTNIISFGQLNHLSKGKRRKKEEEIKERNLYRKKYGVTNKWHRDILGNPRPDTRQTLRTNDFHSRSVLEALSSTRFQPFNRDKGLTSTGYIIATKNGVSLFLRWGRERDRREFQV